MKIQIVFFSFLTTAMLTCSGCDPKVEEDPAKSESSTSSVSAPGDSSSGNAGKVTPPVVESDSELADGNVLIKDDLASVDWRSLVGKQVTVAGDLVVVDTYDLARRGQVKVSRKRLFVPTNRVDPNDSDASGVSYTGGSNVEKVTRAEKFNEAATLILDDGSSSQNVFPPALFPKLGKDQPTVRVGSVIKGVSGEVMKERNNIVLVPKGPLRWTPAKRPKRPDVGNPKVTVASFNVLNYFTTIDDGTNNARGADSDSEMARQESKLVSAIIELNADVIGLMEIENNLEAEKRLVAALNKKVGNDAYMACGLPDGFRSVPGGQDAIRVGIIYRSDRVSPVGNVSMISDVAFDNARAPVVQSFKARSEGDPFTVVVNHFKSKGGSGNADKANKNKGDGQGAYNATRRSQSLAICEFIDELTQSDPNPRVLVIGDLNAYGQEDPIDAMRAKGLVDLHERLGDSSLADGPENYSYLYYGQCGSLDHAMATPAMAEMVTGIATWHINADEPRFLDYNQEFNPGTLFKADSFRSSDHDPVLIGIGN